MTDAALKAAILGIPLDENSSFLRGPAGGPDAIRRALYSGASNLCTENGLDLGDDPRWREAGNLAPGSGMAAIEAIERGVALLLEDGTRVLSLGGDHSISWPVLRAHSARFGRLTILHLDAHADLYDEFEGSRLSHACPFARIAEELPVDIVQVGVRTLTGHQRRQAERFGIHIVEMKDWTRGRRLKLVPPVYLSLDLDVLDPAFAPGVSHHEPGGMQVREVLEIVHGIPAPLVGADIVELNPLRDINGMTAQVGAKLAKELLALLLRA